MSQVRPFSELKDLPEVSVLAASLKASGSAGAEAGIALATEAASFGLSVKDYLILAGHKQTDHTKDGLNSYEKLLLSLNLPIRNDFERGVSLQAAGETFQTYSGTRALFPEVIDDVVRWATRQSQVEQVAPLLANSRSIAGAELLSTVVSDDSAARDTFTISEGANIPVQSIRTTQQSVKIWKHGSAIRTTYEFSRRASIDLMIPYANRVARQLEMSKVAAATSVLINGDGAYGASGTVNQSAYNTPTGVTATAGTISWPHFLYWLVQRAKLSTPIDTVAMNYDGWFQWMMMFGTQTANAGNTAAQQLKNVGVTIENMPAAINLVLNIKPVLSSAVAAGTLVGFSQGDTLEELVEAGSNIQETERAIRNQTMTMVKTENTGYKLVYGDTRSIYNFAG